MVLLSHRRGGEEEAEEISDYGQTLHSSSAAVCSFQGLHCYQQYIDQMSVPLNKSPSGLIHHYKTLVLLDHQPLLWVAVWKINLNLTLTHIWGEKYLYAMSLNVG